MSIVRSLFYVQMFCSVMTSFAHCDEVRSDNGQVLFRLATPISNEKSLEHLKGNAESITLVDHQIKFTFHKLPKSGELHFPRLYARMEKVYWEGAPDAELKFIPEPNEWRVKLDNPPEEDKVVVVKLLDKIIPGTQGVKILNSKPDDQFDLFAHFAETHGEKLRFEPQPHKNTIGYWTIPTDWAHWDIGCMHTGKFHVDIHQGCGTGQGGSEVEIRLTQGKKVVDQLTFIVEDTGHFQNFKKRRLGELAMPKIGDYRLEIHPTKLAKNAVMDVRKMELVPVKN